MLITPRIPTPLRFAALALVGSLAVAGPTRLAAQTPAPGTSALTPVGPFIVRFDENRNATIAINGGNPTTLFGTLLPDPTLPAGVGGQLALTFMLPEPVISGDVSFAELQGVGSDWLRFTDASGRIDGGATGAGSRMLFYSEFEIGETNPSMADQAFPANLGRGNNVLRLNEAGPEGDNGFDYQPGGVTYPRNNEYVGISDNVVPEPGSSLLLASGLVGLVAWRRYRTHRP